MSHNFVRVAVLVSSTEMNDNIHDLLNLPEIKWTSEGQIKKHLSLPSVVLQCRVTLGKVTSGRDLSIGQNTDTHRRRKLDS